MFNKISFEQAKEKYNLILDGKESEAEKFFESVKGQFCVAYEAGNVSRLYNKRTFGSALVMNIYAFTDKAYTIKTGSNEIMKQIIDRLEEVNLEYDVWQIV